MHAAAVSKMALMANPRTFFARTSPEAGSGREAARERSYESRRYERAVMGWVGIILFLVLMLIVALGEDFGPTLVGWSVASASYFGELYGSVPESR